MDAALSTSPAPVSSPHSGGNNNSPYCDNSGCQFASSAYFSGTLPTGMGATWTIGIWTRETFESKSIPFAVVQVGALMDRVPQDQVIYSVCK